MEEKDMKDLNSNILNLPSIFQYTKKKFHYIRGFQQGVIRQSQLTHYYPLSLLSGMISVAAGITSNDVHR